MLLGQQPCPECEPAQVNHFVIRTGSYLGLVLKPLLRPLDFFFQRVVPNRSFAWFDIAGPLVIRTFSALRIGRLLSEIKDDDSDRTKALWTEAKRRGIDMRQYRCGAIKDLFIAKHGGVTRCFDGLPRPRGPEADSLYWMDNKPVMRTRFAEAGIPIAKGASVWSEEEGVEVFMRLQKPVITKPHTGSRSRHTTIHLSDEGVFRKAFRSAKVLSPKVLIEEELEGFVFRGTLIGGKLQAVLRREPPHVIGDGTHTIRELVENENMRSERSRQREIGRAHV